MKLLTGLAKFLSWIFHPLIVPSYLFYLLALPDGPLAARMSPDWLFLMMLILTGFLPALNLLLLKFLGIIPNLHLDRKEDRYIPGLMTTALYAMVAWLFWSRWPESLLVDSLLLMASVAAAGTCLSVWKKVSIHAMSITSAATVLLWYAVPQPLMPADPAVAGIVASGLVMSARLWLGAHTLTEITIGGLTGVGVSLVCLWLITL